MLGIDKNVMNLIKVGFDCFSELETILRMNTNVMNLIFLIQMFKRMDTNVINLI